MGLLQKIGLAAATLVLLGGTAAAQQFSVRVYSRPRVTRVYRVPLGTTQRIRQRGITPTRQRRETGTAPVGATHGAIIVTIAAIGAVRV